MTVLETERLILRRLSDDDAGFMLALMNEPSWLRFIGDRGIRNVVDARAWIRNGPVASYESLGFGLYLVLRKDDSVPIGICGLVKRDALDDVDIGFALMPAFRAQGYAFEAASAVMDYARSTLGLGRILAITSPDNDASSRLLEKVGLRFDRMIRLTAGGPETRLFATAPA